MRLLVLSLVSMLFAGAEQADMQTFECVYTKQASLSDDEVEVTQVKGFKISFLVDLKEKQSYILGNNGSNKVANIANAGGLTFLEVTDSGNVSTTTITNSLQSVHSRNIIMTFGEAKLIPSQYYGKCTLK